MRDRPRKSTVGAMIEILLTILHEERILSARLFSSSFYCPSKNRENWRASVFAFLCAQIKTIFYSEVNLIEKTTNIKAPLMHHTFAL
jgi:hypothetical protein